MTTGKRLILIWTFVLLGACSSDYEGGKELVGSLKSNTKFDEIDKLIGLTNIVREGDASNDPDVVSAQALSPIVEGYRGKATLRFFQGGLLGVYFEPEDFNQFVDTYYPRLKEDSKYLEDGVRYWRERNRGSNKLYVAIVDEQLYRGYLKEID